MSLSKRQPTNPMPLKNLLVLFLIAPILIGCKGYINVNVNGTESVAGSGNVVTEKREITPFKKIVFKGAGTLHITDGKQCSLSIKTDDNLLEVIETAVDGDTLTIKPKQSISNFTLEVFVEAPNLESLAMAGVTSTELDQVKWGDVKIDLKGATKIKGSGTANALSLKIEGVANADLNELSSKSVDVDVKGAGKSTVFATEKLNAKVKGAGSITCYGSPGDVQKEVSGVGKISVH